jgi:hypothetical protein
MLNSNWKRGVAVSLVYCDPTTSSDVNDTISSSGSGSLLLWHESAFQQWQRFESFKMDHLRNVIHVTERRRGKVSAATEQHYFNVFNRWTHQLERVV